MREDNLLAVQPRAFVVTTEAQHDLAVYLNLASRLTVTGINQLGVADITDIRLRTEFVDLAVLLDGFSRKVVGWALDKTLATRVPLGALRHALAARQPPPGLVHHSDRGIQYASAAYVAVLEQHQMIPSMSRPANPYDNASCESFIKTLKREEIDANRYRDLGHLRRHIEGFIEQYYNRLRLHSALGYRPPEEFEHAVASVLHPVPRRSSGFGQQRGDPRGQAGGRSPRISQMRRSFFTSPAGRNPLVQKSGRSRELRSRESEEGKTNVQPTEVC